MMKLRIEQFLHWITKHRTPFPEYDGHLTYGDTLRPAMTVRTVADASQYYRCYVAYLVKTGTDPAKAVKMAKANIRYYTSYLPDPECQFIYKLYSKS